MTRSAAAPAPAAPMTSTVASSPLAFRRDDGGADVPLGGILLLATLLAIAGWAWIRRWRQGASGAVSWPPIAGLPSLGRREGGAPAAALRLLASRRLDGSARVHVLECDGRRYLVGCNGQQAIGLLACLDVESESAKGAAS